MKVDSLGDILENQAFLFMIFILNGFLIGILFDIFRILRKSFKTSDLITYIQDIIFWFLAGFIILYSIFKFNNGELRGFIFIGIAIGALIYMLLFSRAFININLYIIKILKTIFYYIIIVPTKAIFNITKKVIFKPISFIILNFRKSMSNFKIKIKSMYNKNKKHKCKKDFT